MDAPDVGGPSNKARLALLYNGGGGTADLVVADLVLLDWDTSPEELLGTCEAVRARTERPIVVLSERSEELLITQAPTGRDPYEVLHVLPSAPHDLIAEVYGHLVRELRPGSCPQPLLQSRLRELNEAYSTIMAQGARRLVQVCGRQGRPGQPPSSPWQILHVTPGAPPDVLELAHRFWRQAAAAEFESVRRGVSRASGR